MRRFEFAPVGLTDDATLRHPAGARAGLPHYRDARNSNALYTVVSGQDHAIYWD